VNVRDFGTKDRETAAQANSIKRKYFRYPKIYQNDFITNLSKRDRIIVTLRTIDEAEPEYEILQLFFREEA
jgi:hypothetical protein